MKGTLKTKRPHIEDLIIEIVADEQNINARGVEEIKPVIIRAIEILNDLYNKIYLATTMRWQVCTDTIFNSPTIESNIAETIKRLSNDKSMTGIMELILKIKNSLSKRL